MMDVHCKNLSALPSDARLGFNFLPISLRNHNFGRITSDEVDRHEQHPNKSQRIKNLDRFIGLCGQNAVS